MPNKPFVIRDNLSNVIEDKVRLYSHGPYIQDISRTFHPDEITECGRKLCYKINGSKYKLPYSNIEYNAIMEAKARWIYILRHTEGIKVIDWGVLASDCNYNMLTKVDCVIQVSDMEDLQIAVLIKSVESGEFDNVKKNGATRKDIVRIMTDMWLIELANGVIIYENRNNFDFMIYRVVPHNAVMNSIKDKAKELFSYKVRGSVPPRPYKSSIAKECQSCEFFKPCWNKE